MRFKGNPFSFLIGSFCIQTVMQMYNTTRCRDAKAQETSINILTASYRRYARLIVQRTVFIVRVHHHGDLCVVVRVGSALGFRRLGRWVPQEKVLLKRLSELNHVDRIGPHCR